MSDNDRVLEKRGNGMSGEVLLKVLRGGYASETIRSCECAGRGTGRASN